MNTYKQYTLQMLFLFPAPFSYAAIDDSAQNSDDEYELISYACNRNEFTGINGFYQSPEPSPHTITGNPNSFTNFKKILNELSPSPIPLTPNDSTNSSDSDTVNNIISIGITSDSDTDDEEENTLIHPLSLSKSQSFPSLASTHDDSSIICNVNAQNKHGHTALHKAVLDGNIDIIHALLEAKANVDLREKDSDKTALHLAIQENYHKVACILIQNNADIEATTKPNAHTPLFIAASMGHTAIVKTLIEKGAKINVYTKRGDTPLFAATKNGHTGTVIELLALNK